MKDLPTELPKGLVIAAVPQREDARDVLVSRKNIPLRNLPKGAQLATGSLRRKSQILNYRSDLTMVPIRAPLAFSIGDFYATWVYSGVPTRPI